ncbi:hypothetical protein [Bacillus sp. FJAT-22090]|uniref:hypothetical protein n=1 Tax=Bacillus sp. FJAT-22090 TaxID=1581038 RepID=UPI0011A3877D|nr:hypothetical protein [Bacillus sp. FJAT-22090]
MSEAVIVIFILVIISCLYLISGSGGGGGGCKIKPPTTKPRPPAPPSRYVSRKEYSWLDMDAEYFALEDLDRTPVKIKWIKNGIVQFESENNSHCLTCGVDSLSQYVTIIKK